MHETKEEAATAAAAAEEICKQMQIFEGFFLLLHFKLIKYYLFFFEFIYFKIYNNCSFINK